MPPLVAGAMRAQVGEECNSFEKFVDKGGQGWEDGVTNREMRNESVQLLHGPPSEEQAAGGCEVSRSVLIVMDHSIEDIESEYGTGSANDLQEARNAVAELIEAADALLTDNRLKSLRDFQSALTRVRGVE